MLKNNTSLSPISTKMLYRAFNSLNLSIDHANIYLELLSHKNATATQIAKVCDIPRATTYKLIEDLVSREFVLVENTNKVMLYVARKPRTILDRLKLQNQSINDITYTFEQGLYEFENLFHNSQGSSSKTVQISGIDQIKDIIRGLILINDLCTIRYFDPLSDSENTDSAILYRYINRTFTRGGIIRREILSNNESTAAYLSQLSHEDEQIVINPSISESVSVEKYIYANNVLYIDFSNLTALLISGENIYNLELKLFESTWDSLKDDNYVTSFEI